MLDLSNGALTANKQGPNDKVVVMDWQRLQHLEAVRNGLHGVLGESPTHPRGRWRDDQEIVDVANGTYSDDGFDGVKWRVAVGKWVAEELVLDFAGQQAKEGMFFGTGFVVVDSGVLAVAGCFVQSVEGSLQGSA